MCVGAEAPEGPGCRVLFHVLPLEAGLTPDVLIPPGKQEGWAAVCMRTCVCVSIEAQPPFSWVPIKDFIRAEGSAAKKKLTSTAGAAGTEPNWAGGLLWPLF